MPFQQRTLIYFVCRLCKDEYPISGEIEYSKIYKCAKKGCNYEESFIGLPIADYTVSPYISEGLLGRMWHNNVFQGIFAGAILFILLSLITYFITNNLVSNLMEELQEIRNEISLIKGK